MSNIRIRPPSNNAPDEVHHAFRSIEEVARNLDDTKVNMDTDAVEGNLPTYVSGDLVDSGWSIGDLLALSLAVSEQ